MKRIYLLLILLGIATTAYAGTKISEMVLLTAADSADKLVIVDTSASTTKTITVSDLMGTAGAIGSTTPAAGSFTTLGASGQLVVTKDAIGVTPVDTNGIMLRNTTDATAGNQQWSPPMVLQGQGWETNVGSSMNVEFMQDVRSVQGAAAPTGYWGVYPSVNGAAYSATPLLKVDSAGTTTINALTLTTDLSVANGGTGASTAADAFTALKQDATTAATGVVELATNAEVAAFTDETRAVTPEGLGYAMTGLLSYGVSWDESNSSPTLTRTGNLAGITAGASPGNVFLPIQAAMRRCILSDAGAVQYYLCSTDSTKKEDCATASDIVGGDGQVMVEIPKFYYRYSYSGTTHRWDISLIPLTGFEAHPAFYKDGAWVDYRYIGAYEGIGWDNGTTAYIDCLNGNADNWAGGAIDTGNDKLGSVSGFAPMMDETRDEFRAIALNRGAGWRQQDFYLTSAVQLLYLTEYASFYSQDVIGMGRTELTGGTWVKDSYIGVSGKSNATGNATANTGGDTNDAYMSYRGIENFYGNIYQWIDGINVNGNIPYVSNTETDFADDTATAYTRLTDTGDSGITLHNGDGYQTTLEQTKGGFLPSAVGGSSSTYITDYYYQSTGWRVVNFGGAAGNGSYAGAFCVLANSASSSDYVAFGGRISY